MAMNDTDLERAVSSSMQSVSLETNSLCNSQELHASCSHPEIAKNGTTYSARQNKFVLHASKCMKQSGEENYLTPTQRQIRRLRELLRSARQDLNVKNSEILRLTTEVFELRQLKEKDNIVNNDEISPLRKTHETVDDNEDRVDGNQTSNSDSGHFETQIASVSNKRNMNEKACKIQEVINRYERKIEEMILNQDQADHALKKDHNAKIEQLLNKFSKYTIHCSQVSMNYDNAKARIYELETLLEKFQKKLSYYEETQKKLYLHLYRENSNREPLQNLNTSEHTRPNLSLNDLLQEFHMTQRELERIRHLDLQSFGESEPGHLLTVNEAISLWILGGWKTIYHRLSETQADTTSVDPQVKLQFLKSAIYYFLTDNENSEYHLKAIKQILDFSEKETMEIDKNWQ